MKLKLNKKQKTILCVGVASLLIGSSVLTGFIVTHLSSEGEKNKLLQGRAETFVMFNEVENSGVSVATDTETDVIDEDLISVMHEDQKVTDADGTVVIEIPELDIKAPILEGVDNATLAKAAGHFKDTGEIGKGNYCIAGHSSNTYACIFNNLKDVELGMKMCLYDKKGVCYTYYVTENFVVEPEEVWVLDEENDNRLTVITCTDGGLRRQVVVGLLMTEKEYEKYVYDLEVSKRMNIVNLPQRISDVTISDYFKEVIG